MSSREFYGQRESVSQKEFGMDRRPLKLEAHQDYLPTPKFVPNENVENWAPQSRRFIPVHRLGLLRFFVLLIIFLTFNHAVKLKKELYGFNNFSYLINKN